jgi:hypothetical protein
VSLAGGGSEWSERKTQVKGPYRGLMNNMADHLFWRGPGPTDDEEVVNTMPF